MGKPNYEKPTSQIDLEARQSKDYVPSAVLVQGNDAEPSDNGYIGVDPIYQTFANETERPFLSEKGPESKVEEAWVADEVDTAVSATPSGQSEAEEQREDDSSTTPTGSTTTPTTTPATSGAATTPPAGANPPSK